MTDADLVARVRDSRDEQAFEMLYERHARAAMRMALGRVFDHGLAADAVQSAFLDVWRAAGTYSVERGSVAAWILGITSNRCIDVLRRSRTQDRAGAALAFAHHFEVEQDHTSDDAVDQDRADQLRGGVDSLPRLQRQVIELCFYRGLSHAEAAQQLSVPLGTVKSRLRLGLLRLRRDGAVRALGNA